MGMNNNNMGMNNNNMGMNNNNMGMNNNNMGMNNNNMGMNNNNINNTDDDDNNNNQINDINENSQKNNEFTLYFKYKDKELYLEVDPSVPFKNILSQFLQRYEDFRSVKIKKLVCYGKVIDYNKSCNEIGIKTESNIFIL